MLYKKVLSVQSKIYRQSCRLFSSPAQKIVNMEVNDKTGIATVTLNRSPVNSLSVELLKELSETLDEVHDNRSRGMILTSVSSYKICFNLKVTMIYFSLKKLFSVLD